MQCQNFPTAHAAACSVPDARPSRSTTFSSRPRNFSLYQTILTGPPKPPVSGCRVLCSREKRPGRKADQSKSSFAVESDWSHTSTPPVCLYNVNRDSFTYTFTTYTAISALVRFQIVVVKGEFTLYTLDVHRGWFIQSERCKGCFHPHFIQSDQWTK